MPERTHIGLDNAAFNGRLSQRPVQLSRQARPERQAPRLVTDHKVRVRGIVAGSPRVPADAKPRATAPVLPVIRSESPARPSIPRQQRSEVLKRQVVQPNAPIGPAYPNRSRLQMALIGMAGLIFMLGLVVSWQALRTNHNAAAQVSALSKQTDKTSGNADSSLPSTTRPGSDAISRYVVAPDLPRYLKIPKLGVYARVLQVGVTSSGALGTPGNVYDTAWYTGSAKPGQPGATLIDGHVSSWTTHGVFYGLKKLDVTDTIQVVRGDGTILNYKIVKIHIYNADSVDMQAAVTPITPGKPGLNLITCTGQVKKGTSEFSQRVIIFAQQD